MTNPQLSWTLSEQSLPGEFLCLQNEDRIHLRDRLMRMASKFASDLPDSALARLRNQVVRINLRFDPVFTPSEPFESQV